VRFRLDPREADAPAEAPPARAPVPAPQSAPAPAPAARPASRWSRRRVVLAAAIGLLVVAGGSGAYFYATDSGPFAYPHEYLVEGSAVPAGLRLPGVPADVRDQWGITSNPGQIPDDRLGDLPNAGTQPDEAWVEVLQAGDRADAVTIVAAKYADADHASTAVSTARLQCLSGGSAILQDGKVVVLVLVGDSQAMPYYNKLVRTILGQVHGLTEVCG
jgi:hypothetical protein